MDGETGKMCDTGVWHSCGLVPAYIQNRAMLTTSIPPADVCLSAPELHMHGVDACLFSLRELLRIAGRRALARADSLQFAQLTVRVILSQFARDSVEKVTDSGLVAPRVRGKYRGNMQEEAGWICTAPPSPPTDRNGVSPHHRVPGSEGCMHAALCQARTSSTYLTKIFSPMAFPVTSFARRLRSTVPEGSLRGLGPSTPG